MPEPERIDKRSLRYAGRREELLDALTRYVIDNGVGELTVRQLAKAVGVSHASLLNHFESKENLLSEVIENMRGESIPIAVPMKPGVDPAAVLTAVVDRTYDAGGPAAVPSDGRDLRPRARRPRTLRTVPGPFCRRLDRGTGSRSTTSGLPRGRCCLCRYSVALANAGSVDGSSGHWGPGPRRSCVRAFCRRLCRPRSGVVHARIRSPSTLTDHHGRGGLTVGCHSSEKTSPSECFNSHFDLLRTRLDEKTATRA